jgi:trehalose 6-phosphate synthase
MAMPAALRASGVHNPIGFFLHIPFPSADLISTAPEVSDLVQDLLAADLIGFQTANDLENFVAAAQSVAGAGQMSGGSLAVGTRRVRLGVFPVEIESREFAAMAEEFARGEVTMRLLNCMKGQKLILGVDRLDPTKGLLQRLAAMRRLLERHPDWDRHVTLLQIAAVSRKDVTSYRDLRLALNREAGALNSDLGDPDWQPLRLIAKGGRREHMAGYMRHAQVGLVTPLRDGMNLVAKEFVAAQDPLNPGVLVLSRFAGAARQLDAALLVNPHDTDEMADTLDTALRMGLAERQERWQSMWQVLQGVSPIGWGRAFLAALLRAASAQPQGMGQMGRPDMLPPGKIEAPRLTIVERVRSQMEAQRPPATIAPRRMI